MSLACRSKNAAEDGAKQPAGSQLPAKAKPESLAPGDKKNQGPAPGGAQTPSGPSKNFDRCRSWAELDPSKLPAVPKSAYWAAFSAIWDKLRLRHYDPTLNCLDWVELRQRYAQKLAKAKSSEEAYQLYNELLARLDQSHLLAMAPRPLVANKTLKGGPATARVYTMWVKDRLFRRAARPGENPDPAGAQYGEILAIDDISARDLSKSASQGSKRGPSQEKILRSKLVAKALRCPDNGYKTLKIKNRPQNLLVKIPCARRGGEVVTMGNLRNVPTKVRFTMLDKGAGVGYLAFNVWMLPMIPQIQRGMEHLRNAGMRGLLLDLRGNRGGIATMTIPVGRMFWPQGGSLGTLQMRDFSQELKVFAKKGAFAGPVWILIDAETASTSEIFAMGLQSAGRVQVVGASSSAGMALPSIIEGLPDGGLFQYVVGRYESPKRTVAEGRGVSPDLKVKALEKGIGAGQDPVLEAALQAARSKLGG